MHHTQKGIFSVFHCHWLTSNRNFCNIYKKVKDPDLVGALSVHTEGLKKGFLQRY